MRRLAFILLLLAPVMTALAENRFPQPQFESGYTIPTATSPVPRSASCGGLDVLVLAGALSLAAWLILKKRSRKGVFLLTLFSLLYFGFWRKGCVCSVGSFQNVAAWLSGSQDALPLGVAAFFILPLVFALLFGRIFCSAVCPLGAIQEMMVVYPVRLPRPVSLALGLVPVMILGLAVLLAATGTVFIVCKYDPFVPVFRLGGPQPLLLAGAGLLLLGIFVARPFCRFLCPYGVLLNWASRLSKWHATITPDECVQCRLCERSCPFDAIRTPSAGGVAESREAGVRRIKRLLLLLLLLTGVGAWAGFLLEGVLAPLNSRVRLEQVLRKADPALDAQYARELEAFQGSGMTTRTLEAEADMLRRRFRIGGAWMGGFVGLVAGLGLLGVSVRRTRSTYEPDRGECLSCARCYLSCPKEHERLGA